MVDPSPSPGNSEDIHMQRDRDSATAHSRWGKVIGIIAILALLYVGLMLLGGKYGPGGHHAASSHTGSERTLRDPQAGDGRPQPEEGHNRSRDGSHSTDQHRPGDRNRSRDHDHSGDHNRSGNPHRSSESGHSGNLKGSDDQSRSGSMRSILLASTIGYLALLAAWSGLRRKGAFLLRHVASAAAMWLLVAKYLNARGGFEYNVHTWNRAFADASVVLYAVTLAIGPLGRLWRPASHALAWRRETGIWGTLAAVVHIGLFWEKHYGWDGWRHFFYPVAHRSGVIADALMGDRSSGLFPTALNLANVVGLVALAYALVLTVTSNDASQRWLKSGWSWLQERATTMQLLVLLHAWLFAYYITVENTLAIGTLWASLWAVLSLQTAAFVKSVWFRQRAEDRSPVEGIHHRSESAPRPSPRNVGADVQGAGTNGEERRVSPEISGKKAAPQAPNLE